MFFFFFSSRRRHTRLQGDWSSDVCSSDLSSDNCSPKKRRNTGSLSNGWRDERTSFDVEMLTTDGDARRTASLYEAVCGEDVVGGALCRIGAGALRGGSHSGRKVETTKSTATATVAACAKMSQRRSIRGGGQLYENLLEN